MKVWLDSGGRVLTGDDGRPFYSDECCCGSDSGSHSHPGLCCRYAYVDCEAVPPFIGYMVPRATYTTGEGSSAETHVDPAWELEGQYIDSIDQAPAIWTIGDWRPFHDKEPAKVRTVGSSTAGHFVWVQHAGRYLPEYAEPLPYPSWAMIEPESASDSTPVLAVYQPVPMADPDAGDRIRLYVDRKTYPDYDEGEVAAAAPICDLLSNVSRSGDKVHEHGYISMSVGTVSPYDLRDYFTQWAGYYTTWGDCHQDRTFGIRQVTGDSPYRSNLSPEFRYRVSMGLERSAHPELDNGAQYLRAAHAVAWDDPASPDHYEPEVPLLSDYKISARWRLDVCSGLYCLAEVIRAKTCTKDAAGRAERLPCSVPYPPQPADECALPVCMSVPVPAFRCEPTGGIGGWIGEYPESLDASDSCAIYCSDEQNWNVSGTSTVVDDETRPEDGTEVATLTPGTGGGANVAGDVLTAKYYASKYNRCEPEPYEVGALDVRRIQMEPSDCYPDSDSFSCPSCSLSGSSNSWPLSLYPMNYNHVSLPKYEIGSRVMYNVGDHKRGYVKKCVELPMVEQSDSSSISSSSADWCADTGNLWTLECCRRAKGGLYASWRRRVYRRCTWIDRNGGEHTIEWPDGVELVKCTDMTFDLDYYGRWTDCASGNNRTRENPPEVCCTLPKDTRLVDSPPKAYMYAYFEQMCLNGDIADDQAPTEDDKDNQLGWGGDNDDPWTTDAEVELPACSRIDVQFRLMMVLHESDQAVEHAPERTETRYIHPPTDPGAVIGSITWTGGGDASRDKALDVDVGGNVSFSIIVPAATRLGTSWTTFPVAASSAAICGETPDTNVALDLSGTKSYALLETDATWWSMTHSEDSGFNASGFGRSEYRIRDNDSGSWGDPDDPDSEPYRCGISGVSLRRVRRTDQYAARGGGEGGLYKLEARVELDCAGYQDTELCPGIGLLRGLAGQACGIRWRHSREYRQENGYVDVDVDDSDSVSVCYQYDLSASSGQYIDIGTASDQYDVPGAHEDPAGGDIDDYTGTDPETGSPLPGIDSERGDLICNGTSSHTYPGKAAMDWATERYVDMAGPRSGTTTCRVAPRAYSRSGERSGGKLTVGYPGIELTVGGSFSYSLNLLAVSTTTVTITEGEAQGGIP